MKKLPHILLGLSLLFGCSDEPVINANAVDPGPHSTESEFKGLWSGDFTGEDNGTWTLTVQDTGTVVGSFTSKDYNEVYSFSGSVDENGEIIASITLENVVGSFSGNLDNGLSLGSYTVSNRSGDFHGKSSTDDESRIVNNWNYYSAEYNSGETLYYDNEIYCPELYMEFREDGTFTDYFLSLIHI